jgi:hypothetical protein
MKTLHVIVSNRRATYPPRDGCIVCGNADYEIEFAFDEEWDAYETKTARFIWNGKYVDKPFTGTVCPVPVLKNTTTLEVGVFVEKLGSTAPERLLTSTTAIINCKKSIRC